MGSKTVRINGKPAARMLYDHLEDPGETVNIAERAEHRERVAAFSARLREQRRQMWDDY